ncbi:hypothetical protein Ahy_B03g066537 [Arachis hypogaea]|uniref:ATP-dependent DNA helicase n=1 Tax=Arachis hypogaea TaxID=3818 RepID=A0A445A474_ARAHY|nr:hypothetical protein Ahy_B03g066537 [Arachis hypogaea]
MHASPLDSCKMTKNSWASGLYVRRLFVILLTSNNISRPEHVWDRCWYELSNDILYRQRAVMNMRELTMSDDEIKQLCLMDIDKILHFYARTILAPTLDIVEEVNNHLMAIISGGENYILVRIF